MLLLSSSQHSNLQDLLQEDNISITPFVKMLFLTATAERNCYKFSQKMRMHYVSLTEKIRISDNRKSVKFPPVSDPSIFW